MEFCKCSKGPVSKFRNLVTIPDFWQYYFFIFQRFVKSFFQGILDNVVEKRSDGIQYHRVRWYSIPSKFELHKKCYILFSKHYFTVLTHFVQKCFHGIEYRLSFSQILEKWKNNTAKNPELWPNSGILRPDLSTTQELISCLTRKIMIRF